MCLAGSTAPILGTKCLFGLHLLMVLLVGKASKDRDVAYIP